MKKQKTKAGRPKSERGILAMLLVLALAGCVTERKDEKVDQQIERNENRALLEGRLNRLSGEVQLTPSQENFQQRELANVKGRVERLQANPGDVSAAQVRRLQDLVKQAEAARGQEQQMILDDGARQLNVIEKRNHPSLQEPPKN